MSAQRLASEGGVYVHFAYCARRCVYCDFALATPKAIPAARYTDALLAELGAHAHLLGGAARTLYVGGGTPSLWPLPELARFVRALEVAPGLARDAEVTLEANPEEVDAAWLDGVVALGVNRVSLGVQSLDPAVLAALSRAHDAPRALAALEVLAARQASGRLASFSIDLMYGLPGQSFDAFAADLDAVVQRFAPPHLSLYALTVEPHTVLGLAIRQGRSPAPDDALQADMMFAARDRLAAAGYVHYEVSSWARPGHVARHNSAYWELRPWLGLGAGAHGFVAGRRTRNEARPARYIERALEGGEAVAEDERPDADTLAFERMLTGLRRLDLGVEQPRDGRYDAAIADEVAAGRLVYDGARVRLTDLGLRFMDDVLLAFAP